MNSRIEVFKPTGQFLRTVGRQGSKPGQFADPFGIGVSQKGNVYVAGSGNGQVEEFSPTWKYIRSFGTFVSNPGPLAVAPNGDVYVTDGNHILHFTPKGAEYPSFGGPGTGNGQFSST